MKVHQEVRPKSAEEFGDFVDLIQFICPRKQRDHSQYFEEDAAYAQISSKSPLIELSYIAEALLLDKSNAQANVSMEAYPLQIEFLANGALHA